MGHDILAVNNAGEEVAFARFSMCNHSATILYSLLNTNNYYAGSSGSGGVVTFTTKQMEMALNGFNQLYDKDEPLSEKNILTWDEKQISEFLLNCLETSKKEGSVVVYSG